MDARGDEAQQGGQDGDGPDPSGEPGRAVLFERWQDIPTSQLTVRQVEMRRLADSMRIIMERLVQTAAPTEQLIEAADALARVALRFDEVGSHGTNYEGFAEAANAGGDASAIFEHSPFIGRANPLSPPIRLAEVDGRVHAEVVFGSAYEGPPGCVHGGYVAGAFDEVLGATQSLSGAPGMTGTLTVKYRNPTPLHTPLRFIGEVRSVEGRKIFTDGYLYAGEVLCAEAEGIFVSVDVSKFQSLMEHRARTERVRLG